MENPNVSDEGYRRLVRELKDRKRYTPAERQAQQHTAKWAPPIILLGFIIYAAVHVLTAGWLPDLMNRAVCHLVDCPK